MWQLVTLHNAGCTGLPWGNEEWRLFGPSYSTLKEVLQALKTARRVFDDSIFSYRKVETFKAHEQKRHQRSLKKWFK